MKKGVLYINLLLAILFFIACGIFIYMRGQTVPWPKRIDSVNFKLKVPLLAPEEISKDNGYYYLRQLKNLNDSDSENLSEEEVSKLEALEEKECDIISELSKNGYTGKYPAADPLIEKYKSNIELLYQAGRCKYATGVVFTNFADSINSFEPSLNSFKIALYSVSKQLDTNPEKAIEKISLLINSSINLSQTAFLINYFFSVAQLGFMEETLKGMVDLKRLTPKQEVEISKMLINAEHRILPLSEVIKVERMWSLLAIDEVFNVENSKSVLEVSLIHIPKVLSGAGVLGFSKESTKENFDKVYSNYIYASESPVSKETIEIMSELDSFIENNDRSDLSIMFSTDPIGRLLLTVCVPSLNDVLVLRQQMLAKLRSTATYLAVAAYKQDKGDLPATLSELVPVYIKSVPLDPHSGDTKELQYKVLNKNEWEIFTVKGIYPYSDQDKYKHFSISSIPKETQ